MLLSDHLFIIRAIILRNLRLKHLNEPAGFFLEFLRPTITCIAHYFVFSAINKPMPAGISFEAFIWGGFTVWLTFIQIYMGLQILHWAKPPPFLGVSPMHMRLAICAWPVFVNLIFCYVSVAAMKIFGINIDFPNIPLTAFIFLLAAMMGLGLGLLVEGICRAAPIASPIFHLMPYILFMSAGIYFSIAIAPPVLQAIFVWSPVLQLVEYERYAFDPGYPINLVSLGYATICAAGMLFVGLALNRRLRYWPGE